MKWLPIFLLLASCAARQEVRYNPPERWVVAAAVADIRSEPTPRDPNHGYDPLQETQVLQGEPVLVYERRGKWVRVECPLQQEFSHNGVWEGYPGWMEARLLTKDPSREIRVKALSGTEADLRRRVLDQAARHLGSRYLWGGRSLYDPSHRNQATGVDCSGLVNWSFLRIGRLVPRDAHEQFMRARRKDPAQLEAGDLIFLAKTDRPDRIVHVAFYAGEGDLLEAPQTGETVRRISILSRFGRDLNSLSNGDTVGDRVIYFGTLFEGDQP